MRYLLVVTARLVNPHRVRSQASMTTTERPVNRLAPKARVARVRVHLFTELPVRCVLGNSVAYSMNSQLLGFRK
jgi:hypothetical protein